MSQAVSLFGKLTNWQNQHELNAVAIQSCLDNNETKYQNGEISAEEFNQNQSIFLDIYAEETEKTGYTFNFMEGKNPENQEDYMAQIAELASGDVLSKDTDKDGQISRTEYIMGEIGNSISELSPEEKAQTALMASMAFDAINSLVLTDSNPDNDEIDKFLSAEDMQNFYKALDGYNFDEETASVGFNGVFDGELDVDSFGAFMDETTAGIPQEQKQKMYETFLGIFSK